MSKYDNDKNDMEINPQTTDVPETTVVPEASGSGAPEEARVEAAAEAPEAPEGGKAEKAEKQGASLAARAIGPIRNKKFRYGAYSSVITLVVLAVLIAVNLVVSQFDVKFDLTSDSLYSISDKSKQLLTSLEEDVTIYTLFPSGSEVTLYQEILEQYANASSHVKIVNKDPYVNLSFVEQYAAEGQSVADNSIIVVSDKRSKIVDASALVSSSTEYTSDYTSYTTTTTLDKEFKTTNAIVYVTQTETPVVYTLTGHGEAELSSTLQTSLTDANYDIDSVNLLTGGIPEDCSVLIVTTPERDINTDEADKLLNYLQNGGRAMFLVDMSSAALENLEMVVNAYGIDYNDCYVFEGDSNYTYGSYSSYFLPQLASHAITDGIVSSGYYAFVADSRGIDIMSTYKNSITIEQLLYTTSAGFGKDKDSEILSMNKEEGDVDGPLNVALAVTDSYYVASDNFVTKLVTVGTSSILDSTLDSMVYGANTEFIVNSLNWLTDRSDADSVYIPSKTLSAGEEDYITLTSSQGYTLMVFSLGVFPGVILITGIIVWFRRRNK